MDLKTPSNAVTPVAKVRWNGFGRVQHSTH